MNRHLVSHSCINDIIFRYETLAKKEKEFRIKMLINTRVYM